MTNGAWGRDVGRLGVAALAALALVTMGCRHRGAAVAAAPAPLPEEHCWWAVLRTTLPPDSVAARFQRGFAAIGLSNAAWAHQADTAWARAGAGSVGPGGAAYESRAVAYQRGDSTHFRYWVALVPPAGAPAADGPGGGSIAACGRIARAAAVPTSVPREPTGDESLAVWRRRP